MYTIPILLLSLLSLSLGDLTETSTTCANSVIPGPITWSNGGTSTTGYIIQAGGTNNWGPVSTSGSSVTAGFGSLNGPRYYLAKSCATAFGPSVFQLINPLGATIAFTVDVSTAGCGTNAAFYLVGMPPTGAGSNGDYYCDAQCTESCCTEMDLFEANRHALQITPHKCTSLNNGCDTGGCARNTQSITNGYGPSSSFTINTQNTFTVSITFHTTSSSLTSITSVISQGSKSITLTHDGSCGSGYLAVMNSAFSKGLVPVWSFWHGSMLWLDSLSCSSDTNEMSNSKFIFSNLVVTGAGSVVTVPNPPASQHCGSSGCTINANWIEFTPPSGASTSTAASVLCSSGKTFSCTWFASGSKYQCAVNGPDTCSSPIPVFGGKQCPFPSSEISDASTIGSNGGLLSDATIAGIAVGCVVGLIVVVVVIVVVVMKKKRIEEHV